MKLYIFATKRSGQHAIINWLCEQNRPALHYNACNENLLPRKFVMEYVGNEKHQYNFNKFQESQNYKLKVYNFEDKEIFPIKGKRIVIIREPKNWIASRLKININLQRRRINIWKNHARSNLFKIIFDEWFVDKEYRKYICKELGLTFTDKGLNDVFWHGQSSFDKHKFNGAAQRMKVLERWKEFRDDANRIVDEEMKKLFDEILRSKM